MTSLIGKDTEAVLEKHVGKRGTKALVVLAAIAFAGLCLAGILAAGGAIVNFLRTSFTWLQPYLPAQIELNQTASRVATGAVYVLVAVGGWLIYRKVQKLAKHAEDAVGREGVALDAIVESEGKIVELGKQVKSLAGRLDHIEKKVGSELRDILAKQFMEQAEKKFYAKPAEEAPAPPDPKVELGRKLLREAAQELRYAFKEPLSFDSGPSASRGWLSLQITRLLKDILSPDTLDDFRMLERAIEQKREVRGESADQKAHAAKIITFMEDLADGLTDFDLDADIELPPTFEAFKKAHGSS